MAVPVVFFRPEGPICRGVTDSLRITLRRINVANCDDVRRPEHNTLQERACSGRRSDDGRKSATFSRQARVIVNDHREQARSYRKLCLSQAETVVAKLNAQRRRQDWQNTGHYRQIIDSLRYS
ncbi:hypothetical protein D3C73_1274100 [compost metagenome]